MLTSVINIRNAPIGWENDPEYVYIGRRGKGQDGYFGNPFHVKGYEDRGEILQRFYDYIIERMEKDKIYNERVKALKGKILVCFCKPLQCHGDVLSKASMQ